MPYHFNVSDELIICSQCGGKRLVSVNVSAFWDIPERELICQDCGHAN